MGDDGIPVKVTDLKPGDLIDLEGDPYADQAHGHHDDDGCPYEYEYRTVADPPGEWESAGTYRLDYEGGACGFPPGHLITRHGTG